jgi:N-formylmaleamate deformylase
MDNRTIITMPRTRAPFAGIDGWPEPKSGIRRSLSNKIRKKRSPKKAPPAAGRRSRSAGTPAWASGDIRANGIRLHYTRTGGAKPPLVLIHGFSDDGLCWTSVARALEETYDILLPDARGHGRSEAPAQGYGPIDHADDLAGVIAGLRLRHPLLLGHSMGAITVLVLAGRHPQIPRAVVLEDPPAWWAKDSPPPYAAEWRAQTQARIEELQRLTLEKLVAMERAEEPGWSEDELVPWADSKLRLSLNVFRQDGRIGVDWPALLGKIACPVLLLTADPERGALVTDAWAAALRAMVPHVSIAHIAGAGHSIHRDQKASFLKVVRAFFDELPDPEK